MNAEPSDTPDHIDSPEAPGSRSYEHELQDMVEIHRAMFKKLIGVPGQRSAMELAELFEEMANRYLDVSDYLSALAAAEQTATG